MALNQAKLVRLKSLIETAYSELARTSFPTVESTNNMKITYHRVIEDGCIWEGISFMNVC